MNLPKIDQPLFELTIPTSGQTVSFRPYTVKEEKILLIAQESKDIDQIILSTKQVISNCFEGVNVDELSMFDIEYMMLKVRAQSVNNMVEFKIQDPDTKEEIELSLDLNDIEIKKDPNHNRLIKLNDTISVYMNYPMYDSVTAITDAAEKDRKVILFDAMMNSIGQIIDGEEVFQAKHVPKEELKAFIENIPSPKIKEFKEFFETTPKLRFEIPYTNSNGDKKTFVSEGLKSFFL